MEFEQPPWDRQGTRLQVPCQQAGAGMDAGGPRNSAPWTSRIMTVSRLCGARRAHNGFKCGPHKDKLALQISHLRRRTAQITVCPGRL